MPPAGGGQAAVESADFSRFLVFLKQSCGDVKLFLIVLLWYIHQVNEKRFFFSDRIASLHHACTLYFFV